jgi:hypothetical protein
MQAERITATVHGACELVDRSCVTDLTDCESMQIPLGALGLETQFRSLTKINDFSR